MYKLVILGCENSHANSFLKVLEKENLKSEFEVIGVYSDETEAAEKVSAEFGVPVMKDYAEAVDKVDGVIITARHGDNHYKYAKPYMESKIPMFIDKPITANADDAIEFMNELKALGIKVSGGSIIPHEPEAQEIKKIRETEEMGRVQGGNLIFPWSDDEKYGGFWFYTQHLAQNLLEVFGTDIKAVSACQAGTTISIVAQYPEFVVTGTFLKKSVGYYTEIYCEQGRKSLQHELSGESVYRDSKNELLKYLEMVKGGEMKESYTDFFRPVFVLDAIKKAYETGKTVEVADVDALLK